MSWRNGLNGDRPRNRLHFIEIDTSFNQRLAITPIAGVSATASVEARELVVFLLLPPS